MQEEEKNEASPATEHNETQDPQPDMVPELPTLPDDETQTSTHGIEEKTEAAVISSNNTEQPAPDPQSQALASVAAEDVVPNTAEETNVNYHSKSTRPRLTNLYYSFQKQTQHTDTTRKKPIMYLTTTLPRHIESKHRPVQIYNGHKFVDRRNDKPSGIDLYAWQLKAQSQPLYKQLQQARKVLTTQDWMLARDELKSVKTITSIENLKKKNMWSQRQLKRQKTIPRTKTHWDLLLDEMKWMRTDFKEERKWKMANAYVMAQAVMEWHQVEDKSTVCVNVRSCVDGALSHHVAASPPHLVVVAETAMETSDDSDMTKAHPTITDMSQDTKDPASDNDEEDDDDDDEEDGADHQSSVSPQTIQAYKELLQSLNPEQSILSIDEQYQHDMISLLFPDLLLYTAPDPDCIGNDPYFDEAEYSRIVPFKLSAQRIQLSNNTALSRKRNADGEQIKVLPRHERYDNTPLLSPLFAPKKLKDAPATQPPIPKAPALTSSNSGSSSASWSEEDDLCLIQLILQYSFNWELICDAFNTTRSSINGENKTPWDCHERWKQNNLTSLSGQINSGTNTRTQWQTV